MHIKNYIRSCVFFCTLMSCSGLRAQTITTFAGNGIAGIGGDGAHANSPICQLNAPYGMAMDKMHNIYIADLGNQRIRKVSPSNFITTFMSSIQPFALACDTVRNCLYVSTYLPYVCKIDLATSAVTVVAGNGHADYYGDGLAGTNAAINYPQGLAVDAAGNLFIADTWNNVIRKLDTNGIITTAYGNFYAVPGTGDGGPASAAGFLGPKQMCFDAAGNLYIADVTDAMIRKVNTAGIISQVAGNHLITGAGYGGDGGPATSSVCQLNMPEGVAVDADNNVYIADWYNDLIRKVDGTTGIITRYAGLYFINSYLGDGGPATNATLFHPWGLMIDASGNLLVSDQDNNVIRKITPGTNELKPIENIDPNVAVIPNPTTGTFTVTSSETMYKLEVFDVVGKLVNTVQADRFSATIDLAGLPTGIFFVRIDGSKTLRVEKVE